jgi:hypothetical protein
MPLGDLLGGPLPSEFKGDRIVLQMNFAYNMPRQ